MANRHKAHKAKGGRIAYDAVSSNVMKEAAEEPGHKRGGKIVGKAPGGKTKGRFARGGGVGSPFSSAYVGPSGGGK